MDRQEHWAGLLGCSIVYDDFHPERNLGHTTD